MMEGGWWHEWGAESAKDRSSSEGENWDDWADAISSDDAAAPQRVDAAVLPAGGADVVDAAVCAITPVRVAPTGAAGAATMLDGADGAIVLVGHATVAETQQPFRRRWKESAAIARKILNGALDVDAAPRMEEAHGTPA